MNERSRGSRDYQKGGGVFKKGAHSGGGEGAPLLSGMPDAFVFRVKLY